MASRAHSVADLEAGADVKAESELHPDEEYQRIKENYRTTVIVPELPANYPETQAAFQELQNDLQEFLGSHIPKVASLQAIVHNLAHVSTHDNRPAPRMSRMTGASLFIQNADMGPSPDTHPDADQTKHDSTMPSRNSSVNNRNVLANVHMQALQAFLAAHMENIVALQTSTSMSSTGADIHSKRLTGRFVPSAIIHDGGRQPGPEHWWTQRCHSVVVISTATAIFTFALMTFAQVILGDRSRTGFDVGMMFAFLSLFLHFGIIIVGGWGARLIAHHAVANEKEELDPIYFTFYLTICEQMQMLATLLLIIATFIMSFLIFSSLGFPFIVLFVTGIGTIIVSFSAYFKVLITLENIVFLAKNIPRLGWRTLDYVKTNVKTRPTPTY